jgi:hypothetical protein
VGKQRAQRVIARNDEARKVCEELATNVENDEEEVESGEADDGICLGDAQLLLEVVQGGVFGELCDSSVSTQSSVSEDDCARGHAIRQTSLSRTLR